eukprot:3253792-Pyramimonas_sp.AAC.1
MNTHEHTHTHTRVLTTHDGGGEQWERVGNWTQGCVPLVAAPPSLGQRQLLRAPAIKGIRKGYT